MLVDQKKLDLYAEKNFNVLFEGERGVGKTSIIHKTFEKAGLRVKYFSAPTMDPWTDLVGVPTTVTRSDGKEVLRLIPPEDFVDDKYDVIFIDELNRAKPKVMNALMELIQFKTINGKPYNIKMIWAAINPHTEDEEYHVEPLDPAVKDRFQIQIKIPYKVDHEFFTKSYGQVGKVFCSWWDNQPALIQKEISPRRLFDAVGFYMDGGDFTDMITVGNTAKLKEDLKTSSQLIILEKDFNAKNVTNSKAILSRNYSVSVEKYLKSDFKVFEFFLPHIDKEWIAQNFTANNEVYSHMIKVSSSGSDNKPIADEIITAIASVNPGRNNFVRRNMADLEKFLSKEDKKAYEPEKTVAVSVDTLYSKSKEESLFLNWIGDKELMKKTTPLTSADLKGFTWNQMALISKKGMELVNSKVIDIDRCKTQIAERIGFVLALAVSQGLNESLQKVITTLTESHFSNKSYVWNKNNIDNQFSDMGAWILSSMQKRIGYTPDEIKAEYVEMTMSPTRMKNKPSKATVPSAIDEYGFIDEEAINGYDIDEELIDHTAWGNRDYEKDKNVNDLSDMINKIAGTYKNPFKYK